MKKSVFSCNLVEIFNEKIGSSIPFVLVVVPALLSPRFVFSVAGKLAASSFFPR
jgi:hypothetical protein